MTSEADRALLLRIARAAITAHVTRSAAAPSIDTIGSLGRYAGAFVTLHDHGDLRGCIGHVEADAPLGATIARCAVAAATSDPRFPSVSPVEVPDLDIEISILGPLDPVTTISEIEIGRHGLVVEMHRHRGLLLPQVAAERNWDPETFVAQTCDKAGLPADAWKKGATLWRFEAEVFGEREPGG